jgi:Transposase, Mutator family
LGIWSALRNVYPTSAEQRCWNHKLRNVLDVVALKHQPAVKAHLQQIAGAESQREAERLKCAFKKAYERVHPKAVERLERDWERMTSYYAFPNEHWKHIRTTNIIESPFAAVRLRTGAAKRFKRVENATALIWKMLLVVEQNFRKLNAPHLLAEVYAGIEYKDGTRAVTKTREQLAAWCSFTHLLTRPRREKAKSLMRRATRRSDEELPAELDQARKEVVPEQDNNHDPTIVVGWGDWNEFARILGINDTRRQSWRREVDFVRRRTTAVSLTYSLLHGQRCCVG